MDSEIFNFFPFSFSHRRSSRQLHVPFLSGSGKEMFKHYQGECFTGILFNKDPVLIAYFLLEKGFLQYGFGHNQMKQVESQFNGGI